MQLALNKALSDRQKILEKQNQLLANQQQLEASLAKHYQDKANNAKDLASNLRDAADETDKASGGQKDANKTMEQQLSLADRLRNKNKKQGEETDKTTKKNEKQKASWKDLKQAASKFFDTILNKYPAAAGAMAGLASAMKDVGIAMKGIGNLIGSVVKGAINLGKAILALPFKMISGIAKMQRKMAEEAQPLRDAIEGVRKAFGGLNSEMGSKVMRATRNFARGAKSAAFGGRSLMSVFGYGSAGKAKFMEAVTKSMSALQKFAPMISRTFSEKTAIEVSMFQEAFELSDEALAGFVKTAGLAGKDATRALQRAQQAAKSMAKGTGLATKEVLQGMGEMKADFVTFGHLADEEMAAAVVSVKQFGGSIKDLKAVSDKFMNFESAANSLSALNQAFGMQLDAMDMLKAKNPAEQIDKMRQAFFATGRSIEDLNMHEKKMLQQQTNLSDAMLQSAFSAQNQGKSFKEMQQQADKDKKKKLDQTKVLKELADALKKFTGLGQSLDGVGDSLSKGFMRAISLHPAMRSLMRTTRGFLLEVRQLGIDLGNVFMDMLADTGIISSLEGALNTGAFTTFRDNIIGAMRDLANYISRGEGSPQRIIDKITGAFTELGKSKSPAGQSIAKAFTRLGLALKKLFMFVYDKYIEPTLTKMFTGIGKWLDKNKFKIAAFIWPVLKWILIWSITKAVVGAAIGKALSALAAQFVAWGTVTGAGAGAATTFSFTAAMQGLKASVMRILAGIPIVGWAILAGAAVVNGISRGVDQYKKSGSLQKGMKGFAGGIVQMLTFGLVSGNTADRIGNSLTLGIWSGYGKAFDELKRSGSLMEAGKGFVAGVVDGITFGLVSDDSVMNAMHRMFGKSVRDPMEQHVMDLKYSSNWITRELNKDAVRIYESADGFLKYTEAMERARAEAGKTGQMLGLQDTAFQTRTDARIARMKREAAEAKKLGADAAALRNKGEKNRSEGSLGGYFSMDGLDFLSAGKTGGEMTAGLNEMINDPKFKSWYQDAVAAGIQNMKDNDYKGPEINIYEDIMNRIGRGQMAEGQDIDDFLDQFSAYRNMNSMQKDLLEKRVNKTLNVFNNANTTFAEKLEAQAQALGYGKDGKPVGSEGMRKGSTYFKYLLEEYKGNAKGFAVEADKMEQHLRLLKEKNDSQYGIVVAEGFDAARKKHKNLTQAQFNDIKATEEAYAEFKRKMRAKIQSDNSKQIAELVAKQVAADTKTLNLKPDSPEFREAVDNAKERANAIVLDAVVSGDFSQLDQSIRAGAEGIVRKNRSFKIDKKQADKLAALEAANQQVRRLEQLKDIPKRLKKLQASLAGWDEKKTTAVATKLFQKVGKVVAAINTAAKDPKVGLDKVETVISAGAQAGIESIAKFVGSINKAMNVRMFSKKQADTMIKNTTYAMGELPKLAEPAAKLDANVSKIMDGSGAIPHYINLIGSIKKKAGLVYLLSRVNANYRTFRNFSKRSGIVNKALGEDMSSGLLGVVGTFATIMDQLPSEAPVLPDGYTEQMGTTMTGLMGGINKFADSIKKVDVGTFGKAGTVATAVSGFVENYNNIRSRLQNASKQVSGKQLQVDLQHFAQALTIGGSKFKIRNEALIFTININVVMDTDTLSNSLADPNLRFKIVDRSEADPALAGKKRVAVGMSATETPYRPGY